MLAFTHSFITRIVDGSNMKKRSPSANIDGFVLRRHPGVMPSTPHSLDEERLPVPQKFLREETEQHLPHPNAENMTTAVQPVIRSEIDESLKAIDDEPPVKKPRRKGLKRITVKRVLMAVAIVLLLIGGYLGYKMFFASSNIFKGNIFSVFSNQALKKDSLGRSNILIFGTSEDDPSHIEEGSGTDLTDSLMVVSIDQTKKNVVMFSVPRDLWVDYGQSCLAGLEGKINAFYSCAKQGASEQTGATRLAGLVGETFGMDIQYYAKVNYGALKDAVNAVGGITVTIDSDDPRGIYDPNFDWMCRRQCNMVKYPNGPATLDGEHALALARARNANGGYGLGGGNFDREQYQQKILIAIKEKAASAGTLANPVAVSNLIDSLGNNIRTNFETSEIRTVVDLLGAIKKDSIRSISLIEEGKALVQTGQYGGASVVLPVAGIDNFSQIQRYIAQQLSGETGTSEEATIEVLNGSDRSGVASRKQSDLASKGVIVTSIGDTETQANFKPLQWYDTTGGQKPQTAQKLNTTLGIPSSGTTLPSGVQSDADFVIIIGNGTN